MAHSGQSVCLSVCPSLRPVNAEAILTSGFWSPGLRWPSRPDHWLTLPHPVFAFCFHICSGGELGSDVCTARSASGSRFSCLTVWILGVISGSGHGGKRLHPLSHPACPLLPALYRVWIPLRGPSTPGGHRQWLHLPSVPLQPAPQLPQPRVLPGQAHFQGGEQKDPGPDLGV